MPLWERVRDMLIQRVASGSVEMTEIARALDTSPRTLRRRLRAEGKSYPELVAAALCCAAKDLLANERHSVHDVGGLLGFADDSAFDRAFKRWTGMTADAYRARLQET